MVLKNLLRRAIRSLLTIAGIAIGVAAVVALGAMAQGIAVNYTNTVGLNNDLLVTQANAYDVVFSSLDESYGDRIAAVPGVESVEAGVFGWINVDNVPYFLIYGYEPATIAMTHYRIVEGKPVTGPGQIALGRRAVESLNLGLDDSLRLYGVPYRIVGIFETGQAMEESGGVVTKNDAQTITQKQRQVSLFQIGLHRNADPATVMARIGSIDDELTVTKSSEYEGNEQMMAMLQGFAWGIAAIAVLIGGLGMMSAMVMSVMERTREIGTLRAVGWSRGRVVQLILGEAIGLSVIGGLIGSALGAALAWLAGQAPGVGAFLEGSFTYTIFVQGMVTALALGLIGGLFPAWTAANLQPVEALRYEGGGATQISGWLIRIGDQNFRNLWRRRTRTLLSAAGIGIGVATLVMLGGLTDGMIDQLNGLAGSGGTGNITVMQRDVADMSLSSIDERIVSQIRNMPEVRAVSPMVLGFISNRELPLFILSGLDPNSATMTHYQLIEGRYVQRPNEMLIGKVAGETYKLAVGDVMALFDNRYRIVGIFETGVAFEDGGGVIALREAQRLLNRGRTVSFIFVDVHVATQAQAVRKAIDRRFPEVRASLSSEFAQNTDDMQSMFAMVAAIRILAMVVGGIVVANTMIMSIFERTREIGTLRAVGWQASRILRQILIESVYLCALAGIGGAILGVVLLSGLSLIPVAAQFLEPRWRIETFVTAFAVALLLGAIGGIFPAWRASKLRPVEALRYE